MIKYRISWNEIEALEVVRETNAQIVFNVPGGGRIHERREAKRSDAHSWHDTWEDAHAFLIEKAEREVQSLRNRLEQAKGRLGNIKGMKPKPEHIKQD